LVLTGRCIAGAGAGDCDCDDGAGEDANVDGSEKESRVELVLAFDEI